MEYAQGILDAVLQSGESGIGFLFGGGERRKIVILGEEHPSSVSLNLHNVACTGLEFSRAEPRKVRKVPPRVAPDGRLYCFKVPVVLGSPAAASWKETLYAFLT